MSAEPKLVAAATSGPDRVGQQLPVLRRHVTQAMIDDYARASGDFNPIHVDPDYASRGPYGRTIAHGLMTLAFVSQLLNEWTAGRFDHEGELDIAFTGPVFADDTVEITGKVTGVKDHEGRLVEEIELSCTAGDRKVLAGKAYQPLDPLQEA